MPIYEYLCQGCDYRFEVKQRVSDPPIVSCERCGHAVNKVISSPAIMFKGSGWYITDYSNKLKPSENGKGEGNAATPAKPATGSETAAPSGGTTAPSTSTSASSGSSGTTAPTGGSSSPASSSSG
ncbi:MAG: FmdB family zinc ribbon protein [Nitrospiraceae bacterium]